VILPDIRTRKLSFGNILAWAWSIYQTHFVNILIVVLIINIPLNVATKVVTEPFPNSMLSLSESIFYVLEAMAIMFITESAVNNETMSFGGALRRAANRWASGLLTALLAGFILFFLLLLLIVPGIIWSIYFTFVLQVVALRNESGKSALDYSEVLVHSQWGRVFRTSVILTLMLSGLSYGIELILGLLKTTLVINAIEATFVDIITMFATVAYTVLFLNLDYQKNLSQQVT
jgi:hypothetical protein